MSKSNYFLKLEEDISHYIAQFLQNNDLRALRLTSKEDLLHKSMPVHLKGDGNPLSEREIDFIIKIESSCVVSLSNFKGVSTIQFLSSSSILTRLRILELKRNRIVDVTKFAMLTQLTKLDLGENQIVDIAPLESLTRLTELSLKRNQIVDVTKLAMLTQLTKLDLEGNEIVDVAPLTTLVQLAELDLSRNQIVNMTPLAMFINHPCIDVYN